MNYVHIYLHTFTFFQSILIVFFSFELSGLLDYTIFESPKKLLISFVTMYLLSFCFCEFLTRNRFFDLCLWK